EETVAADKNEVARRRRTEKLLLPLAHTPQQIVAADKKLNAAKGVALNVLLKEAARRRMLADLLAPLEEASPGDPRDMTLRRLAEVDGVAAEQVNKLLSERLAAAAADKDAHGKDRDPVEKRRAIALVVVGAGNLRKPDGELLYPSGPDRAKLVTGL